MEPRLESFDRICRACLCESPNMKSLFTKLENDEQSLLDIFSLTVNLSPRMEDELPKQVCGDCELIIFKIEEFRNKCITSDALLKKVFENSIKDQYFDITRSESYVKDDKTNVFMDFEIQADEKKDSTQFSESFEFENQKLDSLDSLKKEIIYEDHDFENGFDENEPLATLPIVLKEETEMPKLRKRIKSKLYWKNKTKSPKTNKHFVSSNTYVKFECKKCNISFDDIESWENHLQTHYPITNSGKEDKTPKEAERQFQCSLCFRRCKTTKTLSKHMKLHERTDNIKYSCDKCKREFKYKSFLESHVISVHMHTEFTCHLCTETFTTKDCLEKHIDGHKEKKKHVCSFCSKAFIMLCTLRDHMRKHTGEKPFLCSTCGKGFSQKTNLAQHTRRHLGVKPFQCGICSKGFVSKGELDAHNRKHSGAHPFVCDDCGNGFTTSSALVKHRRTHTGERPYACDLCPMRFAATGTLKNHRRTHTGERPFQCSLCEKAFVQKTDLISHIRCHTGERPYICSQCGQAFRKAAAMKTHLKMHGKDISVSVIQGVSVVLNGMHEGQ